MNSYFIVATSFAAPFFSDTDEAFMTAASPQKALLKFKKSYGHPFGLYAAVCFTDANAYHKNEKPLAKWLCHHELEKTRLTKGLGGYSYKGHGPGDFEIDGKRHKVENPKDGRLVLERRRE